MATSGYHRDDISYATQAHRWKNSHESGIELRILDSALLPFTANAIQSLLLRIGEILAPQCPGAILEAFGFEFSESLGESCTGNSMDIAELLSALNALTEYKCNLFDSTCAIVQLDQNGTLVPVLRQDEKLTAFIREYDRGSLLVVTPVQGQHEKMEVVHNYLAGREFQQRVAGIVEAYAAMRDDLEGEKRSIQRTWAKREKQLERAMSSAAGLYGDLQGIIGSSSMPTINGLSMPLIEVEGADTAALQHTASQVS